MTMTLLVLACLLPVVAIAFVLKKRGDRASQFVTYVITVCATFAGVWLGLYQADVDKTRDEVQQVLALTDAAMSSIGARWTLSHLGPVPFLDQMTANTLVSKHFEPFAFKSLVVANALMTDSPIAKDLDKQADLDERLYYLLCVQRRLLVDKGRQDLRAQISQWSKTLYVEIPAQEVMEKEGCYVSKPFGTIGAP